MKKDKKFFNVILDVDNDMRLILKRFYTSTEAEAEKLFIAWTKENLEKGLNIKKYIKKYKTARMYVQANDVRMWRIWKFKTDEEKKSEVKNIHIFTAKDHDEAYAYFLRYTDEHCLKDCYYDTAFNFLRCEGKKDNVNGPFIAEHSLFAVDHDDKVAKHIEDCGRAYRNGQKDTEKRLVEDVTSFIKSGHTKCEWYSLYSHIIEDLLYNIPILISKGQSYPTGEEGIEAWRAKLTDFLLHVRLFTIYNEHGIADEKWTWAEDLLKTHPIPYYPGTYDSIDYKKLDTLISLEWEKICEFMKSNFLNLWD